MRPTKELFALWAKVRDGTMSRDEFRRRMRPIRQQVESLLLRGDFNARVHGFCKELYDYRERLWLFVEIPGVEPTNNAAERSLRHAVIWRKLSFGTQSAAGSRFVERMLTVIETCRLQNRNVFEWLVEAVQAHIVGQHIPSLWVPQTSSADTPFDRWEREKGSRATEAACDKKWDELLAEYTRASDAEAAKILDGWGGETPPPAGGGAGGRTGEL
jgi:Transposase IS66 family